MTQTGQTIGPQDRAKSIAVTKPDHQRLDPKIKAYRARMSIAAGLLKAAMRTLRNDRNACDPVGRAAYLNLMQEVFEALYGLAGMVPIDDLVKLSKVVAEQRRAELNLQKLEATANPSRRGGKHKRNAEKFRTQRLPELPEFADIDDLPTEFQDIVRRLYGMSFTTDIMPPKNAQPKDPKQP